MKRISFPFVSTMLYVFIGMFQSIMIYDHFCFLASLGFFMLGVVRFLCLCFSLANAKIIS